MIESGTCKRGDNEAAIFRTLNNDYVIELTRNELNRWSDELNGGCKYLCKLNFKNNLNISVLELVTTENNISLFLESIYLKSIKYISTYSLSLFSVSTDSYPLEL